MLKKVDFLNSLKGLNESDLKAKITEDELRMKKLSFAQRTTLHDLHRIANTALILFIMSMKLGRFFYELTIKRMLYFTFYTYGNGLIHFIAGYHS